MSNYLSGRTSLTTVQTSDIADDAITEAKMATDAIGLTELKAGIDGELISWDAAGNPSAVPVGTATHVLTSNGAGAAPTFQAPAASAGLEFVSEVLASSASSVAFTGFETGYDYEVRAHNITCSTDLMYLDSQYGTGGTPTYVTSNYRNQTIRSVTTALTSVGYTGGSNIPMWEDNGLGNTSPEEGSFIIHMFDPNSATRTYMIGEAHLLDNSANPRRMVFAGCNDTQTAVTAIKWTPSGGTFSGTFRLYKRANA